MKWVLSIIFISSYEFIHNGIMSVAIVFEAKVNRIIAWIGNMAILPKADTPKVITLRPRQPACAGLRYLKA
jgi:hypothetical protein